MRLVTEACPVGDLEPGDTYLTRRDGQTESREVLGVLMSGPLGRVHLEVRKPDGNVVRTTIYGTVARVRACEDRA